MTASPDPSSEHQLLAQWVVAHGRAVRGYLMAMVRRQDVAEDLLQEVYRKAWKARGRYRECGAARAYLIRIADGLVRDRARKGQREVQLEPEQWEGVEPSAWDTEPSVKLTRSEARQQLNEALNQISPDQRRVLLLRYYGGLDFAEIAATVGCPLNTALSHARRGLLALRKILAEV